MGTPQLNLSIRKNVETFFSIFNSTARAKTYGAVGHLLLLLAMLGSTIGLAGCGAGGYPGGGISSLNVSALTLDAGQSYTIQSTDAGNLPVSWTLAGTCGTNCGSVSNTTGTTVVYTAPAALNAPTQAVLTAKVAGTNSMKSVTITVNPDTVVIVGNVTYVVGAAVRIPVTYTGGTAPVTLSITTQLPAGLSFNASTGLITGTATTPGSYMVKAQAVDSSAVPYTAVASGIITITAAVPNITPLQLMGAPPSGTVGTIYVSQLVATGGVLPYQFSLASGSLPPGITLSTSTGLLIGTPTTAGTYSFTAEVTDSQGDTATANFSIAIVGAGTPMALSSPPNATVGTPYTGTIGVSGGKGPYNCAIVGGTLPAGLTASGCVISGTPTVAGISVLTVTATDSSSPQETITGPVTLTVVSSPSVLTITPPAAGTVNVPYTGLIGVSGGTGPYTCVVMGALPAGLTSNNCTIAGTPTSPGNTTVTVTATDSSNPKNTTTAPVTIVINPASTPGTLTLASPPAGTVDTPYTGLIGVSGGKGPYTCTIAGTLPAGLTSSNCTITGTPTVAGTTTLTVTATDSSSPVLTVTSPVSLIINPISKLTLTGTLPNATVNMPYTQTLTAQGGLPPYTYAITSGSLPSGLTLSSGGTISGTPTAVGAYSFTVTATDSESPTPQTASLPLILLVTYPCTSQSAALNGQYAYLFQGYDDQLLGVLAYQTASAASIMANGSCVISAGEIDSNHQNSTATGTIASENLIGTYELGSDYRGLLTVTTINAAGTVDKTTTYALAVKAPTSPATTTTEGSLIESDSNTLSGSKGSGTLLSQTPSAFTTSLTGSYAFGLQGDTPCSPTCTVGLVAGPAATVGEFTTNGSGSITSGMADSNDATTNIASAAVSGNYTTADSNGRLQLSMTTAGTSAASYPTDYAVYVVNASKAFIVSRDTHASYILLAGSATAQTQTTFSNSSLNAPFIGYENSYSNPGLLGATLQNVLNLSTATIFRGVGGTGSTTGTCNITNVDTGGVTGLLNGLTGILGSTTGLSNLLAASSQTGSTTCTVAANGRGVLQYPEPTLLGIPLFTAPAPRVLYLYSPNSGYFLETSYAGLGQIAAQTGSPFSEASTFTGTYVYGMAPASSVASIDNSGTIVSNGNGTAIETLDTSVGIGTLNVVTLGSTSSQTYTAPDPTTGRFTLGSGGTTVLYAITPNTFVLLDTSALTTSPAVSLLY